MTKGNQLTLINFKVPKTTKSRFQTICHERHQMMTSVLNQFLHEFTKDHQEKS